MVLLWTDLSAYGPLLQLLTAVADMGEARQLAAAAEVPPPDKHDRLARNHPLYAVAIEQPGVLLWRADEHPDRLDGFEGKPWRAGAEEARRFRDADVQAFQARQEAARDRRKHRR